MIEYKLGNRYANSILELSQERGDQETVAADFELIREICKQCPDFNAMLKSPVINSDKKKVIIQAVLGPSLSELTSNFIEILVRKKREKYINDIAICFELQYNKLKNNTKAIVTTATPISDAQRESITKIIEKDLGTTLFLEEKVNPEILGGLILKIGDLLYDGSISAKVRQLKNEFEKNPYIRLN